MSGFSLQFNPRARVLPPSLSHDDGILNGDTKATLVAWGDDITFLDRDEDNGRHRRVPLRASRLKRAFLHFTSPLSFHVIPFLYPRLFFSPISPRVAREENLRRAMTRLAKDY